MYMLDTDTCVYILQNNPVVVDVFKNKIAEGIAISSISLAELEYGVYNSKKSTFEQNRNKLLEFMKLVDVLPFEQPATTHYGILRADLRRKGQIIGANDMLIGAHCKSEGLILVTNNTDEFKRVKGLNLENWL